MEEDQLNCIRAFEDIIQFAEENTTIINSMKSNADEWDSIPSGIRLILEQCQDQYLVYTDCAENIITFIENNDIDKSIISSVENQTDKAQKFYIKMEKEKNNNYTWYDLIAKDIKKEERQYSSHVQFFINVYHLCETCSILREIYL